MAAKDSKPLHKHNNWIVFLSDLMVATIASLFAILYIRWQFRTVQGFQDYALVWCGVAIPAMIAGQLLFRTSRIVIRHSSFQSIAKLLFAALVKDLILSGFLVLRWFDFGVLTSFSILIVTDFMFTLVFLIVERLIVIRVLASMSTSYETQVDRLNVMVYGTSDKSIAMVTRFDQSEHYNVIGFLSRDKSIAGQIIYDHKVYWLGEDIESMKANLGIEGILFAREEDSDFEQGGLIMQCLHYGIHILTTPKVEAVNYTGLSQKAIKHMVDNEFIPDGMSPFGRITKRAIDLALSAVLLVVFSPLMLVCYIALKMSDKGPAIYKQERIGRFGRPFNILKFRSMRMDAEAMGPALYAGDDDPRLTKVGKFLRQHHLDELPQLWNVFMGDMAFIGYRPERKFYIDQIVEHDPRYAYLYQIRPGVTSYATLKNGYTDSMEKMLRRLEFDLYYLRHRSLWFDIKILWRTFTNIAFGKKF